MVEVQVALYQLDFCADLTAVQAPIFNLGYMLEAATGEGARFLGLASRKQLTRCELDRVNLETWPELADLDSYMEVLFDRAWKFADTAKLGDVQLGCDSVADEFSGLSALSFGKLAVPVDLIFSLQRPDENEWQSAFSQALFKHGKLLKPTLTADVLPFAPLAQAPVAEPRPKIRLEAA